MKLIQVTVTIVALVGCALAVGYGSGGSSYGGGSSRGGSAVPTYSGGASRGGSAVPTYSGGSSGRGQGQNEAPKPYNFDYNAADEEGNAHYRNEQGDANGNVRGTYGYTDAQGLYRIVEYVADENGFRANIRTNEPGVDGKESPADVVLTAEQPPAGVQGAASFGSRRSGGAAPRSYSGGSSGAGGAKPSSGKSGY